MTDYVILNESRLGSFLAVPEFPSLLTFVTRVPVEMSGSDHSLARIGNNLQNWVQRKVWLGTLKNGNLVIEKRKSCCHSPTQPRVCFLGVFRHPLWHKIIGTNRKSLFRILCTYSHTHTKIQCKTNWGPKTLLYLDWHVTKKIISSLRDEIWHTALPFVSLIIHENHKNDSQTSQPAH